VYVGVGLRTRAWRMLDVVHAPIFVFVHGGAWRRGEAKNYAFPADVLVNAGANFLNQWATNGGNRRIVLGLRYTF